MSSDLLMPAGALLGRDVEAWVDMRLVGRGGLCGWAVVQCIDGLFLADVAFLVVVALDRGEDEHQRQHAEDERLDER